MLAAVTIITKEPHFCQNGGCSGVSCSKFCAEDKTMCGLDSNVSPPHLAYLWLLSGGKALD